MIGWEEVEGVMGKLSQDPVVKKLLKEKFGKEAEVILAKLTLGQPLGDQHDDVLAYMQDIVGNDGRLYTRYTASGSYGPYEIVVRGLGGVYWYFAPDYGWSDDLFDSLEQAEQAVGSNWCDTLIRSRARHYRPGFGTVRKRSVKRTSTSKMQRIELDASTLTSTWHISFRPTRKNGFSVWFAISPSSYFPKKIWRSPNKLTWRTAADVLIGMYEEGLEGDWLNSIKVTGVDTWKAEMLKLSAMTMANPYHDQLQALLGMSDADIESVYQQFGSLIVPSAITFCNGR